LLLIFEASGKPAVIKHLGDKSTPGGWTPFWG
jgi:hypothetical protein